MLIWLFLIVIIIIALNCHHNTLPMLSLSSLWRRSELAADGDRGYSVWKRGEGGEGQGGGVTVFDRWWRRLPGSTCRWGWRIWAGSDPGPRRRGFRLGGNHLSVAGCSDPDWFAGGGRTERGEWGVGAAFPYDRAVNQDGLQSFGTMHNRLILFNILVICSYILMQKYLHASIFIFFYFLGGALMNFCLSFWTTNPPAGWREALSRGAVAWTVERNSQTGQVQTFLYIELWARFLVQCSLHVFQVGPRLDTKYPMGRADECS